MFRLMTRFLFLAIGLMVLSSIKAQDTIKLPVPKSAAKTDSAKPARRKTEVYREAFKHVRRKFDSTLFIQKDTATTSDYAEDLERVYQGLNKVPTITESFVRLPEIDDQLDLEDSALDILKERMSQSDRTLNI